MGFQSVNELEQFAFDDCQIVDMKLSDSGITMELEALIVKRNNTQNTNFTESYAGTTRASFVGGSINSAFKDGYKYYDANEVLKDEIPDRELSKEELDALINRISGAYLYYMDKENEEDGKFSYVMGIEFVDEEENTMSDSYSLHVSFVKSVISWEHYLNRVQH